MDFQINTINLTNDNDELSSVQVHFTMSEFNGTTNFHLSGGIPLTAEEYLGNIAGDKLKDIVRTKLIERLQPNTEAAIK